MLKHHLGHFAEQCAFMPPSQPEDIVAAERELKHSLPLHLAFVLGESNGVFGEYELGLVWPLERIVKENQFFWSNSEFKKLYMPFDHVMFFGDAGNGDQFFIPLIDGNLDKQDVFVWNHEDDSRTWVAPSIPKYIEWYLDGRIKI